MSNDRQQDKRVSETYKELATERTPAHLDQKILEMAVGATSKPGYSRWIAWSRPVAWAATITLCLAITLELAREPSREPAMSVSVDAESPAALPEIEEYKRANDENLYNDEGPVKEERDAIGAFDDLELQQEVAESIAETAASEKTSLARSASKQSTNKPAAVRARSEEVQSVSGATASRYAAANNSNCPAEIRAVANDWLDCILALQAAGMDAAATAERELLIDTFPDFKLP